MSHTPSRAHERIILPLDVPSLDAAEPLVEKLRDHVGVFKIGLELYTATGPESVRRIQALGGKRISPDIKLHHTPATVSGAARVVKDLGVQMLTVHASAGKAALEAAVEGAGSDVCVLAVTKLTSQTATPEEVAELARLARECGAGGIVCSGREIEIVREAVGPELRIVVPGVRPKGSDVGDQVRVVTPSQAIRAGADYLVIGRPIRSAPDPRAAAAEIATEIESALT